jgi:hypothetical protein
MCLHRIRRIESRSWLSSTISADRSARHFESGPLASARETVAAKSRYEIPWPPMKCSSASSAFTSPKVPFSPNGVTADTRSFMPTPARPSLACVQLVAMIALKSFTGRHGKESGRQQVRSEALFSLSIRHSTSSQRKGFSGRVLEVSLRQKMGKVELRLRRRNLTRFTCVTARRIAQLENPCRVGLSPTEKPAHTIIRVEPSSADDSRLQGALSATDDRQTSPRSSLICAGDPNSVPTQSSTNGSAMARGVRTPHVPVPVSTLPR